MIIEAKGYTLDLSAATWRKSSRSGPYSDNCVEVAFIGGAVAVRDSKDPGGTPLVFAGPEWGAFVARTRNGGFDLD